MTHDPIPTFDLHYWTSVIDCANPVAIDKSKPCDDTRWINALLALEQNPDFAQDSPTHLMAIAQHVAQSNWPEHRRAHIDFALAFLTADVMLFRSGYTKRHLLTRLRQSELTVTDIKRLDAILRRSVQNGTGLEEYRAYCKLAARLVVDGNLPDLQGWLDEMAQGAILTQDTIPTALLWESAIGERLFKTGKTGKTMRFLDGIFSKLPSPLGRGIYYLTKPFVIVYIFFSILFFVVTSLIPLLLSVVFPPFARFVRTPVYTPPANGVAYPDFKTVVPAGNGTNTPAQKTARNAFKMLYAIQMRQALQKP